MQLLLLGCALGILISLLGHRFFVRPALEKAIGELLKLRRIITELENRQ